MLLNIFSRLFKKSKEKDSIEIKDLSNSNVLILQSATKTDLVDISSLFNNNPYNDIIIENPFAYNGSLAILSDNISYRNQTIETILKSWENKVWLNIYGGYDTGKSQLSLLINDKLKYSCLSYSFKELPENEFKKIIVQVIKQILINELKVPSNQLIIFDDLPQLGFDDNINKLFVELISYCENNDIKVLSTSNYKINRKIIDLIKGNFIELPIPLLNETEVKEIISTYNDNPSSLKYAPIIEAISDGYPVYIQIICQYLENNNWVIPEDELTNFISGKAFNELDDETYQKLLHTTQNESAREILYRLNIISGTISNETIEIVSNANPAINSPFEKIIKLSGTWLQKNNDNTYFLSPLIKRLGSNNVNSDTKKEINNKLAHNILSKKNLSQYDSQKAIAYFLAGESYNDAGMIMIMTLQSYFSHPEIFTETLFGAFWVDTPLPEKMNAITKLSIRILQLHIFDDLQIKKHKKYNPDYKSFVRSDLELLLLNEDTEVNKVIELTNLILFKSYIQDDINQALKYFDKLIDLNIEKIDESEQNFYKNLWIVLDKIYHIDELKKWFEIYEKAGKPEDFFDNQTIHLFSRRLFDNLIENNSDWNKTIEILEYIEEKALFNNLELLAAYAAKNKIFITSEELDNLPDAEAYYNKIQNSYTKPEAIFLIKDELGRQQFYKGKKDAALLNLLDIETINISVVTKLDTYLTIAKIFGENDKIVAHEYTKKALDFAQNEIKASKLSIAKLLGEYAISSWLLGDSKTAIYKLAECYDLLLTAYKEIDSFENIDDYNIVVVQVGSALNYIFQILSFGRPPEKTQNGDSYVIPYRGILNNNYNPVLLKEWYYEERKYMNVYIFIQSFEFYNDKDNAIKWANIAFEMDKEIFLYNFKNSLRSFVGYKILQNKYQESVEIEKELTEYEKTINIGMADGIQNSQQKQMFLDVLERLPSSKNKDDYYLIYNFIPIVLRELTLFLENKSSENEIIINLKEHLLKSDSLYSDDKVIKSVLYILDNYPSNYDSCKNLIDCINGIEIETESKKHIQIICYLICSLKAPTKESLKLHLALMPYLEKTIKGLSTGSYLFILYAFVYKFWTSRVLTNPQDFYFLELWEKNLNKNINVKNKFKVVAILTLACMHLAYRPNENEQNWMQPYIDFVIENK